MSLLAMGMEIGSESGLVAIRNHQHTHGIQGPGEEEITQGGE